MMETTTNNPVQVGEVKANVIAALGLNIPADTPILLGDSNINHMKSRHPNDYEKYGKYIEIILRNPDYVGINPSDNSIEYVKEFCISDNEYVKVAIRVSQSGSFYARSLYTLNPFRVKDFVSNGTLKKP
mgnify:CR=1 FL=1